MDRYFNIGRDGGRVVSPEPKAPTILEELRRRYPEGEQQIIANTFQRQVRICVRQASGTVTSDYDVPDYVVALKDAAENKDVVPQATRRPSGVRRKEARRYGQ
ncbi:MAG: hypothetical protein WC596_01330 [Candidatus Shapirobacteria bacterium]